MLKLVSVFVLLYAFLTALFIFFVVRKFPVKRDLSYKQGGLVILVGILLGIILAAFSPSIAELIFEGEVIFIITAIAWIVFIIFVTRHKNWKKITRGEKLVTLFVPLVVVILVLLPIFNIINSDIILISAIILTVGFIVFLLIKI